MQSVPARPAILLADPEPSTYFVPAPARARLGLQSATFTVNSNPANCVQYYPDAQLVSWPQEAETAFSYAVAIWESLITSQVPIAVNACWWSNLGPNTLGMGGPKAFFMNFENAPLADTWYWGPLANALAGEDLSPGAEIEISLNASVLWYFGTDGTVGGGKIDLASVVLHEIGHGLGFAGYMASSYSIGVCGGSADSLYCPSSYDHFATDENGVSLLSYFDTDRRALGTKLTSNAYFGGPNAMAQNGSALVRLYTPSIWQEGSSYNHLDESFNNTPNALMTYSLNMGEADHNPGPVALGVLRDMGWTVAANWPGVDIAGPRGGEVGKTYTYTATYWPVTTTQPLTYAWTATGQAPVVHMGKGVADDASFTWTSPGAKEVSVTASGAGTPVGSNLSVTIVDLTLTGPVSGTISFPFTFTANFFPETTQPISYTWTATGLAPITHTTSSSADTASFTWTTPGAKHVAVTATGLAVPVSRTLSVSVQPLPYTTYLPIVLKQY